MGQMIFLLVLSYSVIVCLVIGFIMFAVGTRNVITGLKDEITGLRSDVQATQSMYRSEIRQLLDGFRGLKN